MQSATFPPVKSWSPNPHIVQSPYSYARIIDHTTSSCWDSSSILVGAEIRLLTCDDTYRTPTQTFKRILIDSQAEEVNIIKTVVLMLVTVENMALCVEYMAPSNVLKLQPCRSGYQNQMFTFDYLIAGAQVGQMTVKPPIHLQSSGYYRVIGTRDARFRNPFQLSPVVPADPLSTFTPIPWAPDLITTLSIDDYGCLDGTDPNRVLLRTCHQHQASQLWYHVFGRIRNVENGLCLDAPNAYIWQFPNPFVAAAVDIRLSDCRVYPVQGSSATMFWGQKMLISGAVALINGASGDCAHPVVQEPENRVVLKLGTDGCNLHGRDILQTPIAIRNLQLFTTSDQDESSGAAQRRTRSEFRDTPPATAQTTLFKSIENFHDRPSMLGLASRFHDYLTLYSLATPWIPKNSVLYIAWHRVFLSVLENEIGKVSLHSSSTRPTSSFSLPYWNWLEETGRMAQNRHSLNMPSQTRKKVQRVGYAFGNGVLVSEKWGTCGRAPHSCVIDVYEGWQNWEPCIHRGENIMRDGHIAVDNLGGRQFVERLLTRAATGEIFNDHDGQRAERNEDDDGVQHPEFHAFLHDMARLDSSFTKFMQPRSATSTTHVPIHDPLFWMHHAFLDSLWVQWEHVMNKNGKTVKDMYVVGSLGNMAYPPRSPHRVPIIEQTQLFGFNVAVGDVVGENAFRRDYLESGRFFH